MAARKKKSPYLFDEDRRTNATTLFSNWSFDTDLGYICTGDFIILYQDDFLAAIDYDPAIIYAVNINHSLEENRINISSLEMRLGWENKTPYIYLVGERTLIADISGKALRFYEQKDGGTTTAINKEAADMFLCKRTSNGVIDKAFPLVDICSHTNSMMAIRALHKNPGLLNQAPIPRKLIIALSFIKNNNVDGCRFFGLDFSEYRPLYECLGISEEQFLTLIKGFPIEDKTINEGLDYNQLAVNYTCLSLLKARDPDCFEPSVEEMMAVVQNAYHFDTYIIKADSHGISPRTLLRYLWSEIAHYKSIDVFMEHLRHWLDMPRKIVQGKLPNDLESANAAATEAILRPIFDRLHTE